MNKPRIFVFGDSWPAGHLTEEIVGNYGEKNYSIVDGVKRCSQTQIVKKGVIENNFPLLIGKILGIPVHNRGVSSHSNTAIVNDFWDYIVNDYREGDFVLMCWTNWNRLTVRGDKLDLEGFDINSFPRHFSAFTTGRLDFVVPDKGLFEDTTDTLADNHFKLLQSAAAYHMFKNICNEKNIKYLQISSFCHDGFNNEIRPVWDRNDPNWIEADCDHNTLMDIIMRRWKRQGKKVKFKLWIRAISEYNRDHGYTYINKLDLHPNEEGHKLIAETLAPYIKRKLEE